MELFHYTDKKGYDKIKKDGFIKASSGKRAKFGKGVYLTSLDPNEERRQVAETIYSGGATSMYNGGRLDHYIRIKNVGLEEITNLRPHVYLMKVDKLTLDAYEWDGGENSSWRMAVAGGLLAMGTLAIAAHFFFGEKETTQRKLERILREFQQSMSSQNENDLADSLEVFSPDHKGEVCIWCTRCFVRACPGFSPDAASENVNEPYIVACIDEHIHEGMHKVNTPTTVEHSKFRNKIKEEYGDEAMYFKLESCVNSYQNLNRQKHWIHRLQVDIQKEKNRVRMCVLCTRCDLCASSAFWLDAGEGTIQEEKVHQEIEQHFTQDVFRMHKDPPN